MQVVSLVLFFTAASTDRRHLLWYGDWERGYDQHTNKTNVSHPLLSTLISNIMIGAHPPGTPPMKRGWFVLTARKLPNSELLLATCLPSTKSLPVSASFSARRECHCPSHTLEPVVVVYSTMTALGPLSNKNRTCNKVDVSHLPKFVGSVSLDQGMITNTLPVDICGWDYKGIKQSTLFKS